MKMPAWCKSTAKMAKYLAFFRGTRLYVNGFLVPAALSIEGRRPR